MAKIAIFDSGVGGLSIFQAVQQQCPDASYVFVSDNQAYPYGTKSAEELIPRVVECTRRIISQFNPDILVIACNTASTVVLPILREQFTLPIVGVVPAIKPAAQLSKTGKIALLATPATISRRYTQQLINDFAKHCDVLRVGSSKMVQIAEQKLAGIEPNSEVLKHEIQPILDSDETDVVILACTHFPILNNDIKSIFNLNNHSVSLLDSGQGVANQVKRLVEGLVAKEPEIWSEEPSKLVAAFTQVTAVDAKLLENVFRYGFSKVIGLKV